MRALIIDQDHEFSNILSQTLKNLGCQLDNPKKAEDILQALLNENYDIIFFYQIPSERLDKNLILKTIKSRDRLFACHTQLVALYNKEKSENNFSQQFDSTLDKSLFKKCHQSFQKEIARIVQQISHSQI